MLCQICRGDKLSQEFIPLSLTKTCDHPRLICLRCAVKAIERSGKCPYQGCCKPVERNGNDLKEFKAILECLFMEIKPVSDLAPAENQAPHQKTVDVVMLTGERSSFSFDVKNTVFQLKEAINKKLNIPANRQRLLYGEKELTEVIGGKYARLVDHGVPQHSSILLISLLYEIPSHLDHVKFDLYWGYPNSTRVQTSTPLKSSLSKYALAFKPVMQQSTARRDYLDATCFIFSGYKVQGIVDYRTKNRKNKFGLSVCHSGDVMNDANHTGHHTIDVHLKNIPSQITHLFFTLSAWNSPTIQHFRNPSLKFFDASSAKKKDLCSTSFNHAMNSQAVVMCSVSRKDGIWRIFNSGQLSAGNAKNYEQIVTTIQRLINQGV